MEQLPEFAGGAADNAMAAHVCFEEMPGQCAAGLVGKDVGVSSGVDGPEETAPFTASYLSRNLQLAELLARAAEGNTQAFEEFYLATIRIVGAVVGRIAGSNHAEDVLSEAYFQAWRQAAAFDAARANALTWLLAIARSRALDKLRRERSRHAGLAGAPDMPEETVCPLPGPDALLETRQSLGMVRSALAQLSGPERWVLTLVYYHDLTHTEIAGITDFPLGTVKTLIRRAREKLAAIILCVDGVPRFRS